MSAFIYFFITVSALTASQLNFMFPADGLVYSHTVDEEEFNKVYSIVEAPTEPSVLELGLTVVYFGEQKHFCQLT